jgi:hypothetical protein
VDGVVGRGRLTRPLSRSRYPWPHRGTSPTHPRPVPAVDHQCACELEPLPRRLPPSATPMPKIGPPLSPSVGPQLPSRAGICTSCTSPMLSPSGSSPSPGRPASKASARVGSSFLNATTYTAQRPSGSRVGAFDRCRRLRLHQERGIQAKWAFPAGPERRLCQRRRQSPSPGTLQRAHRRARPAATTTTDLSSLAITRQSSPSSSCSSCGSR